MPSTDLVILSDVATHLNWNAAEEAANTSEMTAFITAMTPVVEEITGPVVQRAFNQWYSGGGQQIILRRRPVVSITSITETIGGTTFTLTQQPITGITDGYGYTANLDFGILTRRVNGNASDFATGVENVNVQYVAGYCADTPSVPRNIWLATLELIRINWQPKQTGNVPSFGNSNQGVDAIDMTDGIRVLGFFVPNRVAQLLRPGPKRLGIA